jgi:hypothetical protein
MSEQTNTEPSGDPHLVERAYRRLSPYESHPDAEMDAIGWSLLLGMVVLLVPLFPFILIVWVLSKLIGAVARRRGAS